LRYFNISFVGAGKVAGALCSNLYQNGHTILNIISRNEASGHILADSCKATWSDQFTFPDETEVLIVAVPDQSIAAVAGKISCNKKTIIAHTAGSSGLDVFPPSLKNTGVFYPLQTFSEKRKLDLSKVPFFIEGSDGFCEENLRILAESISSSIFLTDTVHRRLLHLAAVFASNFTNHMLTIAKNLSDESGIPFEVFRPLILETIDKAIETGPEKSQTGPAMRYDLKTIEKHLDLLTFSPEIKSVYEKITKSIISHYKLK
jgi:predicted short-subunit dehydrogenase-like oxidoreductase (DUF2520 family)